MLLFSSLLIYTIEKSTELSKRIKEKKAKLLKGKERENEEMTKLAP